MTQPVTACWLLNPGAIMHNRDTCAALIVAAILALPFALYFWGMQP
jgi:hypothetical protein